MAKRHTRNRVNAKGRNNTTRFARLDYRILRSNAYRSLAPNSRSLLVELISLYNGENNGSLYLSVRDAASRLGVADLSAATRAFNELIEMRFIEMTQDAYFWVKAADKSRARSWRLTWLAGPGRKAPSWDFESREPKPKTKARKRMERGQKSLKAYRRARDSGHFPVLDSDIPALNQGRMPADTVMDSNTLNAKNSGIPPKSSIRDFATHIATTIGSAEPDCLLGWWQPDWKPSLAALTYSVSMTSSLLRIPRERRRVA